MLFMYKHYLDELRLMLTFAIDLLISSLFVNS